MSILPTTRPKANAELVGKIIEANGINQHVSPVILIGIRGRFLDSMGAPARNDRGFYDDAAYIVSPAGIVAYNFNTDPSRFRAGRGSGSSKGMAMLKPGIWRYKPGMHWGSVPHQAFRQAASVQIWRDAYDGGQYDDVLDSSINIHRGGKNGTSSLGCQTVPPAQWDSFRDLLNGELKRYNRAQFLYVLIDETKIREGVYLV